MTNEQVMFLWAGIVHFVTSVLDTFFGEFGWFRKEPDHVQYINDDDNYAA